MSEPEESNPLDLVLSISPKQTDRPKPGRRRILKWILGACIVVGGITALVVPALCALRESVIRTQCALNLKDIAQGLITYSNAHGGRYPDTFAEFHLASGMSPVVFRCPASNDTPATGTAQQQAAALESGGHLSYVYLGKGLTSQASADTVLVYEPLSNHHNTGINVLFDDYHVEWLDAKSARVMISSIVPGQPLIWHTKTTPEAPRSHQTGGPATTHVSAH